MNKGKTIFSQLMSFLPQRHFQRCVLRYDGDKNVRTFSCWDQFLCMSFAQLTYRESLRDIETCLRAAGVKLYHIGIKGRVSRNTLSYANSARDWRIFADFGHVVIGHARKLLRGDDFALELDNSVYALDSTVIELCLTLFPWTYFTRRESKGGVKVHALLDVKRNIPVFIDITERKVADAFILDTLTLERDAVYVMDRGYLHWARLYQITRAGAFFVTRAKHNTALQRIYSRRVDKSAGVRSDQIVRTCALNPLHRRRYPAKLRRIAFFDAETNAKLVFLTNNFELSAETIAHLYKRRWQVELFFKWIKQHLRIKAFYGTSMNAVKTQIWIAITTFVLVAIVKKRLCLPQSPYTMLQVFSVMLFEKKPILQAFSEESYTASNAVASKQLLLLLDSVGQ